MKNWQILFILFVVSFSLNAQTIDSEMARFFGNGQFEMFQSNSTGLTFGFRYIDETNTYFDKLLILNEDEGIVEEVFRIERHQITDYWSEIPYAAPVGPGFIFYGYIIHIAENSDFSLDVYSNNGRNSILRAQVYFWNPKLNRFEPLY